MSDCSTNAMKPKEAPKTCGGCCKSCKHGEHLLTIYCRAHNVTLDDKSRCFCGGEDYVECTDTIEQRYQQLEQVAQNMFHSFCFYCKHEEIIKSYRTQLEALGVSVDD